MSKRTALYIFALAIVARAAMFGFMVGYLGGERGLFWTDSVQYTDLALNMAHGHGFSLEEAAPFVPDSLRTPAYPVFVAAHYRLFGNLWSTSFTQIFLGAGVAVFAYWLGWRLTGRKKVAILAGVMTAIEPHFLRYTLSLSTEGFFLPLFCLFFYVFTRYLEERKVKHLLIAAVSLGLAALTRPVAAGFLPVALVIMAYEPVRAHANLKRLMQHAALLFVVVMALLTPWMYRNYKLSGQFTLSTIGWVNVYTRLAMSTEAAATGKGWADVYTSSLQGLVAEGVIQNPAEKELYQAKFIPLLRERSLAILRAHPKDLILLQPITLNALFSQDNTFTDLYRRGFFSEGTTRPPFSPSMMLQQQGLVATVKALWPYMISGPYLMVPLLRIMWYLILLAAFYGSWDRFRRGDMSQKRLVVLCWAFIGFLAVTILPVATSVDARYRVSFEPMYFALAAAGVAAAITALRRQRQQGTATCLLCGHEAELIHAATTGGNAAKPYLITDSALGRHNALYFCTACGEVSQPFPGGAEALTKAYRDQPRDMHYLAEEAGRRRAFAEVLIQVEKRIPKGRVLDIGGGPGLFLVEARSRGWQVEGMEPSTTSVRLANGSFGLGVVQGTVADLKRYPNERFDLVTAFDVAEHLLDPSALFAEAHRILRKGGLFVWTTPRYGCVMHRCLGRWWYNIHPFHIAFFTQQSAGYAADRFGFRCLEERSFKRYFSIRYFLFRLGRFLPGPLVNLIRRSRIAGTQIPVQLYDEFELYFEKV